MVARAHATRTLTVRRALEAPALTGAEVLAGARGLDRVVERMNVMEVPDILPWVKPRQFLLTTAYPLRDAPEALVTLVGDLDARGLSGLGVKVGRYIDALPPKMLARADELGFPLVRLPETAGFDDILNEVLTDILNQQAAALARSEQIHRSLVQTVLSGGGLSEIARDLAALLDAATLVADVEGRILAAHGLARVAPTLRAAGLLQGDDVVHAEVAQDGAPDHVVVPVSAGARLHGHILAVADSRPLGDDDVIALETAATIAALAITKSDAIAAVESRYRSELLHDLLGGRIEGRDEAVARAASLGWDIDRPLIVMVVSLPAGAGHAARPGSALDRVARALDEAARERDPRAAVVAFSREVVVITGVPAGDEARRAARATAQDLLAVAAGTGGDRLTAGVSRVVRGPLEVPSAYEQARTAGRVGAASRTGAPPGSPIHFDDLGAFRLLSLIDDDGELDRYAADVLGPLAGDDAAVVDLRATLEMVLATNLNIAESARRLHFHYNTLRYRVDKLEGLLGPFTSDADLRLNLELALQVLRLRGRS